MKADTGGGSTKKFMHTKKKTKPKKANPKKVAPKKKGAGSVAEGLIRMFGGAAGGLTSQGVEEAMTGAAGRSVSDYANRTQGRRPSKKSPRKKAGKK